MASSSRRGWSSARFRDAAAQPGAVVGPRDPGGAAWLARIAGAGSVLGAVIGGILVAHVSSSLLKLLLGALLIGSAIKVFWRHEG
jgi:hypothetical protein